MSNLIYNILIAVAALISSPFSNNSQMDSQSDFENGQLTSNYSDSYQLNTNRNSAYTGLDIKPIAAINSNVLDIDFDESLLKLDFEAEKPVLEPELDFSAPAVIPDYPLELPEMKEENLVLDNAENVEPASIFVPDYLLVLDIEEEEVEQIDDSLETSLEIIIPDYLLEIDFEEEEYIF